MSKVKATNTANAKVESDTPSKKAAPKHAK